jgi:hypothetical protein
MVNYNTRGQKRALGFGLNAARGNLFRSAGRKNRSIAAQKLPTAAKQADNDVEVSGERAGGGLVPGDA